MSERFVSRGFVGKRRPSSRSERVPPGQHEVTDFPVLSAGPTPRARLDKWTFRIEGEGKPPVEWTWEEFQALPFEDFTVDIHCVTKWTKLDTQWRGVRVDRLLAKADVDPAAAFLTAFCDGGYTTNLPLADAHGPQAFVATTYAGRPLPPEHGGPARLVVPNLYFWKSAKWVRGLRLQKLDRSGFWESAGYHNHGDPWKEERYAGD